MLTLHGKCTKKYTINVFLSYEIQCVDKLFWFKYATVGLSNKIFFGTPTTTSKINYIHLTTVITIKPYIKMTVIAPWFHFLRL